MTSDVRAGLRVAVLLAAAGALAGGLAAHWLTFVHGGLSLLETAVFSAMLFVLVLGALVLGGRRGLMLLWALLLLVWARIFGGSLLDAGGLPYALHYLPDVFTAWNLLALPVGVATAVLLHRTRETRPRALIGVMGVWIVLAVASAAVSRYAPDVGGGPRDNPLVAWPLKLLLPAAPLVVGGWMILRLRRRAAPAPVAMDIPG